LLRSQKGSLRTLVSSCRLPVRQALVTDVTQGQFKLLDDFFCIALPFWRELQGDRVGLGVSAADAGSSAEPGLSWWSRGLVIVLGDKQLNLPSCRATRRVVPGTLCLY
jgi:hypothetical protein